MASRARQTAALRRAADALRAAGADHVPLEIVADHLRAGHAALGAVTGRHGVEAVLDRLFATFCIGK